MLRPLAKEIYRPAEAHEKWRKRFLVTTGKNKGFPDKEVNFYFVGLMMRKTKKGISLFFSLPPAEMGRSTLLLRGGQSNRDRLFKVLFILFFKFVSRNFACGFLFNFLIAVIDCNFLLPIFQRNFSFFFYLECRRHARSAPTGRHTPKFDGGENIFFFFYFRKEMTSKRKFSKNKKKGPEKTKNVPGFFTAVCVSEHITGNEHGREERPNEFGCVIVHDSAESFKLLKITPAVSFIFPRLSRWDKCGCLFFFF